MVQVKQLKISRLKDQAKRNNSTNPNRFNFRRRSLNSAFFIYMNFLLKFLLLCVSLFIKGCSSSDNIYLVKGTIQEIRLENNEVIIAHDSIRDLMPPMTMPFPISENNKMKGFKKGDSVHFEFQWNDDFIHAKNFRLIGDGHIPIRDDFFDDEFSEKKIGERIDNVTLLNMDSNKIILDKYDEYLFISYIFSKCPMPNLCPAIFIKNKIMANQFVNKKNIKFILVSFDYIYDTPSVLRSIYGPSIENNSNIEIWSSTGHVEDVYKLVKQSGGDFWGVENGKIGHELTSILISPDRDVLGVWKGEKWNSNQVSNSISMIIK